MSQHISRPTYRPGDGFLGVYLEEGAPLVDADVNEAQDIHWNLARLVARDAGLVGTRGATFEVQVASVQGAQDGEVRFDVMVRGSDRPFYIGGIPVMHLWDRTVQARAKPRTYVLSLLMQVSDVDDVDLPDLRDRAVQASSRGAYRRATRFTLELVERPGPGVAPGLPIETPNTEIRMTTRGVYSGLDACYRIEIADCNVDGQLVDLLWDPDNAATRTLASQVQLLGKTRSVQVDDPRGFDQGHLVRLEGPGLFERMPTWPDELAPRPEIIQSRCPVYEISAVFGDLLYLKEADRNRPDEVEIVAPKDTTSLVVRDSPCWVEGRRLILGYFEPALLVDREPISDGSQVLVLDGSLELPDFDKPGSVRYLLRGPAGAKVHGVQSVNGSTVTVEAVDEEGVVAVPGQPVFVYREELDARSIKAIERRKEGRAGLTIDSALSREIPLGLRRIHLPESQGADGVGDLIADYLSQTPIPSTPGETSKHPLTADSEIGDSFVRVLDRGAWQVGRIVEIGVIERYQVKGQGEQVLDQTRFNLTGCRQQPLKPTADQVAEVRFTDERGRTLAEARLVSLEKGCLWVQTLADGVLEDLCNAQVHVRMDVESRRIIRVQPARPVDSSMTQQDVVLLLDRPLSMDHRMSTGQGVAPFERVFLRRFLGATWDAAVTGPGQDLQDVSIDRGLRVQLTRDGDLPNWRAGQGWTVWTRGMGYREALYDAPVDDPALWRAPLAFLEVVGGANDPAVHVTDLRAGDRCTDEHEEEVTIVETQYSVKIGGVPDDKEAGRRLRTDPVGRHYVERLRRALGAGDIQEASALLNTLSARRERPAGTKDDQ